MKIIHLSDLHFGTEISKVLEALQKDLDYINADTLVISGDLTQSALIQEYEKAKLFIDRISVPLSVCVPGNHDISLFNLFERMMHPYRKFNRYISDNFYPNVTTNGVSILGLNSSTPLKPMGGFISESQLDYVENFFDKTSQDHVKIITMHHNLIRSRRHSIINDAEKIITKFASCNINLILSGHVHFPRIEQLRRSFLNHYMYVITAGTPISSRTRVPNSYNIIDIGKREFTLTVREYEGNQFQTKVEKVYNL